jgi:hypothetical protein
LKRIVLNTFAINSLQAFWTTTFEMIARILNTHTPVRPCEQLAMWLRLPFFKNLLGSAFPRKAAEPDKAGPAVARKGRLRSGAGKPTAVLSGG